MKPHLRLDTSPARRPGRGRAGRPLAHHRAHRRACCGSSGRTTASSRTAPRRSRCTATCPSRTSRSSTARARSRSSPTGAPDLRPRAVLARRAQRPGAAATSATTTASGATASPSTTSAARRGRSTTSTAGSPLEPGVVSRFGVAALDDSRSFVFERRRLGQPARRRRHRPLRLRLRPRLRRGAATPSTPSRAATPVLPRWALGNWWSRYHRYSADSYLELLDRFEAEGLPFSVAVLDMDWHRVDVGARALRLGLDRLQLGARAVPRPRGASSPSCTAAACG